MLLLLLWHSGLRQPIGHGRLCPAATQLFGRGRLPAEPGQFLDTATKHVELATFLAVWGP